MLTCCALNSYIRSTNLSRFTVAFANHAWAPGSPDFPSRRAVGRYLESFAARIFSGGQADGGGSTEHGASLRLRAKVVRVDRLSAPSADGKQWVVRWEEMGGGGRGGEAEFDRIVIASGFFAAPHMPRVPGLDVFPGHVLHSSELGDPVTAATRFAGQVVVVAGASFSAVEAAAALAMAARVVHVAPRALRVLPRYLPLSPSDPASGFVPLDLALYQRRAAPAEGVRAEVLQRTLEECRRVAARLDALTGAVRGEHDEDSEEGGAASGPHVAVSDDYAGLVAAGRIEVLRGRVTGLRGDGTVLIQGAGSRGDGKLPEDGPELRVQADSVIFATGFRPDLSFLSPPLRAAINLEQQEVDEVDGGCRKLSLLLSHAPLRLHRLVWHPQLPGAAFVGCYRGNAFKFPRSENVFLNAFKFHNVAMSDTCLHNRPLSCVAGPYFAVIDLQARWVAAVMTGRLPAPTIDQMEAGVAEEMALTVRGVRARPQFPHGDYVGLCLDYVTLLGLPLPQAPAAFVAGLLSGDPTASAAAAAEVATVIEAASTQGRCTPAATFRALPGRWRLRRRIESRHPGSPSGEVRGEAWFTHAEDGSGDIHFREAGCFSVTAGPLQGRQLQASIFLFGGWGYICAQRILLPLPQLVAPDNKFLPPRCRCRANTCMHWIAMPTCCLSSLRRGRTRTINFDGAARHFSRCASRGSCPATMRRGRFLASNSLVPVGSLRACIPAAATCTEPDTPLLSAARS